MDIASWAECCVYNTLLCTVVAHQDRALRLDVSRVSGVNVSNGRGSDGFVACMNVRPT